MATVRLESVPEPAGGAVHRNVNGVVPVALPARTTVLPELTLYGPPAFATGATPVTGAVMVTTVETGTEIRFARFVAVTVSVTVRGNVPPVGAVYFTFAAVAPFWVTVRPPRTPAGTCVTENVSGVLEGTFTSVALTAKVPNAPATTVGGAIAATVGARNGVRVSSVETVDVPQALVAVKLRLTGVLVVAPRAKAGAVKTGVPIVVLDKVPCAGTAHDNAGDVPVLDPARVTVDPLTTVYGPPLAATGGTQIGTGATLLGQGFSTPATTPVSDE